MVPLAGKEDAAAWEASVAAAVKKEAWGEGPVVWVAI